MDTVLVTRGAGLSPHTCKSLAASCFAPVVYDNPSTGRKEFVKRESLVQADMGEMEKLNADTARTAIHWHQNHAG